jgi:hypothetical protein
MVNITKSGMVGFLEGYKARNLATNKVTIDFHVEEMIRLINELKKSSTEGIESLDKSLECLKSNIDTTDSIKYYENSRLIGESLKNYIDLIKDKVEPINSLLKKTIYQYLNLVKKLEADEQIKKLATEVAQLYQTKFLKID